MMIHRFAKVMVSGMGSNGLPEYKTEVVLSRPINKIGGTYYIIKGFKNLVNENMITGVLDHYGLTINPKTEDVISVKMADPKNDESADYSKKEILSDLNKLDCYNRMVLSGMYKKDAMLYSILYKKEIGYYESKMRQFFYHEVNYHYKLGRWFSELDGIGPDNEWSNAAINFGKSIDMGVNLDQAAAAIEKLGTEQVGIEEVLEAIKILQVDMNKFPALVKAAYFSDNFAETMVELASCVDPNMLADYLGVDLASDCEMAVDES